MRNSCVLSEESKDSFQSRLDAGDGGWHVNVFELSMEIAGLILPFDSEEAPEDVVFLYLA